jgi:hypothetical protein
VRSVAYAGDAWRDGASVERAFAVTLLTANVPGLKVAAFLTTFPIDLGRTLDAREAVILVGAVATFVAAFATLLIAENQPMVPQGCRRFANEINGKNAHLPPVSQT